MNERQIDLNKLLIKPLYLGLMMNIFIPVLILGIAYYIDVSGGRSSTVPDETLNIIFWALAIVSVLDGIAAIIVKQRLFFQPMIRSKETFEDDLTSRVTTVSIICYSMTTSVAVYGFVLYLFSGKFDHFLLFVFISFIAFQLIRPRYKFMERVVQAQEKHVGEGRFYRKR
jgi:hypothetical protein